MFTSDYLTISGTMFLECKKIDYLTIFTQCFQNVKKSFSPKTSEGPLIQFGIKEHCLYLHNQQFWHNVLEYEYIVCTCNHLTNFGIILDWKGEAKAMDPGNN